MEDIPPHIQRTADMIQLYYMDCKRDKKEQYLRKQEGPLHVDSVTSDLPDSSTKMKQQQETPKAPNNKRLVAWANAKNG